MGVIRLDQFLKREGIAATGGQAKLLIQSGEVKVNGVVETRRKHQVRDGDRIEVTAEGAPAGVLVVEDLEE